MTTENHTAFLMCPISQARSVGGTPPTRGEAGGHIKKASWTHVLEAALSGLPLGLRGDQALVHGSGFHQLRPDAGVRFLAEHLPGQFALGFVLYSPRFGWVHVPASRQALVQVLLIDLVRGSEPLTVFGGNFFTHGEHLSDSLGALQANR